MVTQTNIGHGRGWLAPDAAASLARVDARLGRPLDVNSAGRTWAQQKTFYDLWKSGKGNYALPPGTSRHESGLALDTDDRIAWIGEHGWVADVKGEPWHYEYRANLDQHRIVAPAFPLPAGSYFGPKSGPAQSVSGFYSHRADLRRWQQRMKDRGWKINPDGLYGDQTGDIAEAFQREKGLTPDRLIGSATWGAAWTAPVT